MKKLLFTAVVVLLIAGIGLGQELKKGNLVGVHFYNVTLKPGVTMDQYLAFYQNKMVPAWEKSYPGAKAYLARRLRGTGDPAEFDLAFFIIFPSAKERDKYFTGAGGETTELGKAANKKLEPINAELSKLVTSPSLDRYTDWLIY